MTIGGSIFLIALGAILAFAVEFEIVGLEINVIGYILMIAGVIGLLVGLFMRTNSRRVVDEPTRRRTVVEDRDRDTRREI